jgi:calcium/calmodulin-dependent protein kinase I
MHRALGVLVYIILGSYPPFLHHTPLGIKAKIIHGIYEFHPEYWGHISEEAKDFVKRLLTVDMNSRMTADEALRHPWVSAPTILFDCGVLGLSPVIL